jgi:hypothetical protein
MLPLEGNLFPTKPQLEMDCCALASVESIAATTLGETSSTIETLIVLWDLMKKNQEFWKPKSCNSICWAFFQPISSSSTLEINSSAFRRPE